MDRNQLAAYERMFPHDLITHIKTISDLDSLSGGEKQVIDILRTLMQQRQVMIFDEPFSALNAKVTDHFCQNLKQISKDKIIIAIAHNDESLNAYFDHVIYL